MRGNSVARSGGEALSIILTLLKKAIGWPNYIMSAESRQFIICQAGGGVRWPLSKALMNLHAGFPGCCWIFKIEGNWPRG